MAQKIDPDTLIDIFDAIKLYFNIANELEKKTHFGKLNTQKHYT